MSSSSSRRRRQRADFPIVSFEGESNRIDEDAKGVVNVGETGDMEPGTSTTLTIDMGRGTTPSCATSPAITPWGCTRTSG